MQLWPLNVLRLHHNKFPPTDGTYQITECVDCDDEIISERLKMGCIRCVYCQEKLEKTYAKR